MLKSLHTLTQHLGGGRKKRPKKVEEHELIVTAGKRFLTKIGMEGYVNVHVNGANQPTLLLTVRETNKRLSMMALAMLAQELMDYFQRRHELTLGGIYWEIDPDADSRVEWPDETHYPNRIHVRELDPDHEAQAIAALIHANQ